MTAATSPLQFFRPGETDVSRRTFLKLLSATAAAAGAVACAEPSGEIVPYVSQPPEVVPGVPLHFATAMELDGYGTGLIVESREGRPVKIEGNPLHPASLGAAGVFHQAAVLQLYDPDRPQYVHRRQARASWLDCAASFGLPELQRLGGANGDGVFFLLEPTASPIVGELIRRIRQRLPAAHVHFYAPLSTSSAADGTALAIGRRAEPLLDLTAADVIVAADFDLVGEGPLSLRYARQFADRRRVRGPQDRMNRLYAIEGRYTPTGVAADHRLAVRPSAVPGVLASLLQEVLAAGGTPAESAGVRSALDHLVSREHGKWARVVAADLVAHHSRAVVAVGPRQSPLAHSIAAALNEALGATGHCISYVDPILDHESPLSTLVGALRAQHAKVLIVIGGNPSYTAPVDMEFRALLQQVPLTLFAGSHDNETAHDTQWFVPLAHFLESWGDTRSPDGTTSIVQPLISPLHGGRSTTELLAFFAGDGRPSNEIVRSFWLEPERLHGDATAWRDALRNGVVRAAAAAPVQASISWGAVAAAVQREPPPTIPSLEIAFVPDPSVHDGRFANNGWLQEMPDPVTKLTWDNAAFINETTGHTIGAHHAGLLELAANGRRLRAPAFVIPGIADGLIVLPFGYGRSGGESIARDVGVNAYTLWTSNGFSAGVAASPVPPPPHRPDDTAHPFAVTQLHWSLEGRPIVLDADLDRFVADPHFTADHNTPVPTLYLEQPNAPRQWAMAIDLSVCTGCSACVVACQAENNVPIVGKFGVQERREMHWLRIDRYLTGTQANPRLTMQPMLCQQCENAPCEYVCPVNATTHSPDGLNEMVYNRCVGTRFCSNNCPYKVRRFNFLNYTQELPETERMAMNPDVTVRDRGVMEKCTFCVQRIRRADIDAGIAGSDQPYARLQTACQQACPTRAIVFGSITDPDAQVTRDARADQSYRVLNELGTRPRISYLARLRNRNHALDPEESA